MTTCSSVSERVVALAGGVGGSKLAFGLYAHLGERLSVIVNTGDDDTMYGLRICPDLDTVRYTLSGLANPQTGWGMAGDTFQAMDQLERYGLEAWFRLGDRDLATHMARTKLLAEGRSLTEVEAWLDERSGLACRLLPMCDQPVATRVTLVDGRELSFQEYFVKRRHADAVRHVAFAGADGASLSDAIRQALAGAACLILCPSNPVVSIGPILSVPGLRSLLRDLRIPRVAVSPIIGDQAVSGPAGQLMAAVGCEVSVLGLAGMYGDFLTGMIIDEADRDRAPALRDRGLDVLVTNTLMKTAGDKRRLASDVLEWASVPSRGLTTQRHSGAYGSQ
jgi:LPPG:FO 2-phospho-L-lactate transferase